MSCATCCPPSKSKRKQNSFHFAVYISKNEIKTAAEGYFFFLYLFSRLTKSGHETCVRVCLCELVYISSLRHAPRNWLFARHHAYANYLLYALRIFSVLYTDSSYSSSFFLSFNKLMRFLWNVETSKNSVIFCVHQIKLAYYDGHKTTAPEPRDII